MGITEPFVGIELWRTSMSYSQRIIAVLMVVLAIGMGGGCLCWLTGDCEEGLVPPKNPTPANGAVDVPTNVTLSWEGGDTHEGKIVRHDLYLGAKNPPLLYRPSVTGRTLSLDSLAQARTYYWRVILIEENGRNLVGPLWSFTTEYPPEFLSVAYPNWATTWSRGETRTIQWRSAYAGNDVRIELFKSGNNLCTIAESTPNDGYLEWELTSCADKSDPDYRIKVTSLLDESLYDYSDFFTVVTPCPIEVTAPRERDVLIAGQKHPIRWHPLGFSTNIKVSLHLFKGSDFRYVISSVTPDDGEFDWVASDFSGGTGNDYRIRVTDLNQLGCSKFSGFFSILPCNVSVTSPATDDIWPLGTQHAITWDTTGLPETVELELYNQGEFVCVLDEHVDNTGTYLWTVNRCDSPFGDQFQIRLLSANNGPCGFSGLFDLH